MFVYAIALKRAGFVIIELWKRLRKGDYTKKFMVFLFRKWDYFLQFSLIDK